MRPLDGIISHRFPHLFLIHLLPAHMLNLQNHCHLGRRAMPLEKNERAIVHVVDDDASLRGALESLFDSVGLGTRSYATARDFLAASSTSRGAMSSLRGYTSRLDLTLLGLP